MRSDRGVSPPSRRSGLAAGRPRAGTPRAHFSHRPRYQRSVGASGSGPASLPARAAFRPRGSGNRGFDRSLIRRSTFARPSRGRPLRRACPGEFRAPSDGEGTTLPDRRRTTTRMRGSARTGALGAPSGPGTRGSGSLAGQGIRRFGPRPPRDAAERAESLHGIPRGGARRAR